MNDFFDSLKDIKKELVKEQNGSQANQKTAQNVQKTAKTFSKEEAIAHKEEKLGEEFLAYIENSDIRKI